MGLHGLRCEAKFLILSLYIHTKVGIAQSFLCKIKVHFSNPVLLCEHEFVSSGSQSWAGDECEIRLKGEVGLQLELALNWTVH